MGEKGRAKDGPESVVQGQLLKGVIKGSEYRAKQRNDEINRDKSNLSDRNLAPSNGKGLHFRLSLGCDSSNGDQRRFVT